MLRKGRLWEFADEKIVVDHTCCDRHGRYTMGKAVGEGLKAYYKAKIEELEILARDKQHNLRRLEAQRNELNTKGVLHPFPPVLFRVMDR